MIKLQALVDSSIMPLASMDFVNNLSHHGIAGAVTLFNRSNCFYANGMCNSIDRIPNIFEFRELDIEESFPRRGTVTGDSNRDSNTRGMLN